MLIQVAIDLSLPHCAKWLLTLQESSSILSNFNLVFNPVILSNHPYHQKKPDVGTGLFADDPTT